MRKKCNAIKLCDPSLILLNLSLAERLENNMKENAKRTTMRCTTISLCIRCVILVLNMYSPKNGIILFDACHICVHFEAKDTSNILVNPSNKHRYIVVKANPGGSHRSMEQTRHSLCQCDYTKINSLLNKGELWHVRHVFLLKPASSLRYKIHWRQNII